MLEPRDDELAAERSRRDFPALAAAPPGLPRLVYLDNAATTQKPESVIDAIASYYRSGVANAHRGAHRLGAHASAAYEAARVEVQRLIGAEHPDEIVLTSGCTAAINLVARTFGDARVSAGDDVIVTTLEHHANLLPWQLLCERRGARLRVLPASAQGEPRLDVLESWLTPRTRLVAVTHVANTTGGVSPIGEIVGLAARVGARVLVDGAQAVARMAVDVRALGCDFYAFSGHKLYGPAGIGVLYGRRELLAGMGPFLAGGGMVDRVTPAASTYAAVPRRFEAGTPNVEGAIGLARAIEYVRAAGIERVARHDEALTLYARQRLAAVPGVRLVGVPRSAIGVVSFVMDGVHPHDVSTVVDDAGVAVRAGHHCAQLCMQHFGVQATVRASFALYNTRADIDALCAALARAREIFEP
jgi:cysteine desulfurase / selenocysteine lyase